VGVTDEQDIGEGQQIGMKEGLDGGMTPGSPSALQSMRACFTSESERSGPSNSGRSREKLTAQNPWGVMDPGVGRWL